MSYVEREALAADGWHLQRYISGDGYARVETMNIMDIPAADVVEVRHARWIKSESSGLYKCSKCGRYATNSDVLNWEYCNCGAKMDGGANK